MSYLFSQSGSRSLNSSSLSVANASASRAQLTASLLAMGFPLTRVQPLVSLINPHNENALELALELLTRDADDDDDDDDEDVEDEDDGRRERDDDDGESGRVSAGLSVLMAMTGCTMAEARAALQRERDINAAADAILQQQERKDSTDAAALSDERVEKEAAERGERHERWTVKRRQTAEKLRKAEAEGDASTAYYLHYGDVIMVQHVDSGDMLQADSEQQGVLLAPYSLTPSLTSPTNSSRNPSGGNVITSPLSLSQQAHASPRNASSSPIAIIPPSLSLSSASPPRNSGRSLLSSSPSPQRKLTMPPASGVFPPSAPLQTHSFSSLSSSPPAALSSPTPPFHSLSSLSPKPRSLSTPRKSSHPLSFSLPSHHRFHLTLRPAAEKDSGCGEDGGLVMSGDSVLVETYERCYLCVEADGSIGCNRTAPITQQMVMTVKLQHTGADDDSDDEDSDDDTAPICVNSTVTLTTLDRHYAAVADRHLTAKGFKPSAACYFNLSLAHRSANPLRSHRRASSSSPRLVPASTSAVTSAAAGSLSPAQQRWSLLRRQWRLAAVACLQASINERRSELLALQRVRRVQSEDAKRLCAICLDAACSVVMLDCGHLCACEECGRELKECVVCRQRVDRVVSIRPIQQDAS